MSGILLFPYFQAIQNQDFELAISYHQLELAQRCCLSFHPSSSNHLSLAMEKRMTCFTSRWFFRRMTISKALSDVSPKKYCSGPKWEADTFWGRIFQDLPQPY